MKLTVLGSGTCVPSLKRNAPGYYIEEAGKGILLDCGSGTLLQMAKSGISYKDTDAVFITHRHPDHTADLMPLIQSLLATPGFKREKDLFVFAPESFIAKIKNELDATLAKYLDFQVNTVAALQKFTFSPFEVSTEKTVHSADSIAYRFECNSKSIVYTGDADYDKTLVNFSDQADLLIADCSFPEHMKAQGHLSAKECGIIANEAGVKKLVLSHLYPADTPDGDRVRESREAFSGEIVLAEDLMEISL